jgi:hypothetical protein
MKTAAQDRLAALRGEPDVGVLRDEQRAVLDPGLQVHGVEFPRRPMGAPLALWRPKVAS